MEPSDEIAIIATPTRLTLDQCIAAWVVTKTKRTNSEKTRVAYQSAMTSFRAALCRAGLDLDSDATLVALVIQGWAGRGQEGRDVSESTFNQRIAILSSFYKYAIPRQVCIRNPVQLIERKPNNVHDAALPMETDDVTERLAAIDRGMPEGQRDHALLTIGLVTGRRASELASLRRSDLRFDKKTIVITWQHCKGDKLMADALKPKTAAVLSAYLQSIYGTQLVTLPTDAPIWVSFSRNNRGKAISAQAVSDICEKRLGTSKVHTLRHTFALSMEKAGAPLSVISERLGHSNLKTTSDYLKRLHKAENDYASKLEELFGL